MTTMIVGCVQTWLLNGKTLSLLLRLLHPSSTVLDFAIGLLGLCLTRDTPIEHCHSPAFRERISEDGKAGRTLTLRLTFVDCLQASFLFISVLQRCF